MRTFFLFYLLTYLLRNPLLALLIALALVYLAEARYSGRFFNPGSFYSRRRTIHDLERTLAINEHDAAARNDLGRLLVDEGRYADAYDHLARAIQRMDDSAETQYFYGIALMETGQAQEGIKHVLRALEISPRFRYGEPQLALARHHLEQGDAAEAEKRAGEAVKINTSSLEAWVIRGRARERLGDPTGAREAWNSAVETYDGLPRHLKMAARKWRAQARRALRSSRP